jgi:hypothetical protein
MLRKQVATRRTLVSGNCLYKSAIFLVNDVVHPRHANEEGTGICSYLISCRHNTIPISALA